MGAERLDLTWWQLFRLARRWWGLLLLAPLVSGLTAVSVVSLQGRTYSAEAVLTIDPGQGEQALDYGMIDAIQYQAETYERLIERDPVLMPVVAGLALPYGVDTLREQISARAVAGTQLFLVTASDGDPERAAALANAVADQFLVYVEGLANRVRGPSRAELDRQIDETRRRMEDAANNVQQLEAGSDAADPVVRARIDAARASLEQSQGLLPQLLSIAQQMDLDAAAAQSRLVMAVPASTPSSPDASGSTIVGLLAAFGGLLTTAGALILFEAVGGLRRPSVDRLLLAG